MKQQLRRSTLIKPIFGLEIGVHFNPRYEEAHYNLGCKYRFRGRYAQAERHLRRAIELDPKYSLAYAELGALLSGRKNRAKEAVGILKKALAYDPEDGWSRAYLANALWGLRTIKAADEQYRKLIELWPDNALSYWCYGDFLAYEGREPSVAEGYLRKALEMDPKSESTNYYLGKHLFYWNREKEAVPLLKKAARLGHPHAQRYLDKIKNLG